MKHLKIFITILFASSIATNAQYTLKNMTELEVLNNLPQEKVYLDHTGPLIFTGEYLYYSFDCFNVQTHTYSNVSKIGYVALVNDNKEFVIENKIRLVNGKGKGDFFISTEIPSGNYKLLGYTNWMKNNGLRQVFKQDVIILNPYRTDQSKFLQEQEATNLSASNSQNQSIKDNSASFLNISLQKNSYGKRERVEMKLNNFKQNLGHGIYNIKVIKKSPIIDKGGVSAVAFSEDYLNLNKTINKAIGDTIYLPEQKGELLMGTVTDKGNNSKLKESRLIVSIPGEEFILKTVSTSEDGQFYAYLDKDYTIPRALIQVEDGDGEYEVVIEDKGRLDLKNLKFDSFQLKKEYAKAIKMRSIHNQISNQFFSETPDSVMLGEKRNPFDWTLPEVKKLDDFTRFSTFGETIIELYHNVSYRENGNKPDYIRMELKEGIFDGFYEVKPAIVLIDGVFIPNHEEIKAFNARKIESINIVRDIYRIGNKEYHGLMSIKTFDGDYYEDYTSKYGSNITLDAPSLFKNYYRQSYSEENNEYNRIPDYRYLLFWEPHFEIDNYTTEFDFFTSDVIGEFEIVLNGFTHYGKPISLRKTFTVE